MASTTEPKGEVKDVAEDVFTETLRYKTWILKLSIHCPACGKKVTKILKKIDGVYITKVDFAQQRVTVIGDVEPEIMIKALTKKTAKRVELILPDSKANPEENQFVPKNREKQSDHDEVSGDKKKGKQPVKGECVEVVESGSGGRAKNFEVGSSSYIKSVEEVDGGKQNEGGGGRGKMKEVQADNEPCHPPPVVAKKQSEGGGKEVLDGKSGAVDSNESGGGGGKKKKSKEHNVNVAEHEMGGLAPSTGSPPAQTVPMRQPQPQVLEANVQTIGSTVTNVQRSFPMPHYLGQPLQREVYDHPYYPRQQQFEYPHQGKQQYENPCSKKQQQDFIPVHAMNYHATQTSISNDTARYAAQLAYSETHTYAHWRLGNEVVDPPASHLNNLPAALPSHPHNSSDSSDTFAYFSDENPNACIIM